MIYWLQKSGSIYIHRLVNVSSNCLTETPGSQKSLSWQLFEAPSCMICKSKWIHLPLQKDETQVNKKHEDLTMSLFN